MKNGKVFSAIEYIDPELIDEAETYKKEKKNTWVRWSAIAACFILVAMLVIAKFSIGLFGVHNEESILENGETITFVKSDMVPSSTNLDVDTRALSDEEVNLLFADLPISANAYFDKDSHNLVGIEGEIENCRLMISVKEEKLWDTDINSKEYLSNIEGIDVNAGYYLSKANSRGEKTATYYASFKTGENSIYIECSGDESEREALKTQLADILLKLINNGQFDLSQIEK